MNSLKNEADAFIAWNKVQNYNINGRCWHNIEPLTDHYLPTQNVYSFAKNN